MRDGLAGLPAGTKVLFTAHSLPARVAGDGRPVPRRSSAARPSWWPAEAGLGPWTSWGVAWQSAGRTPEPWLGPDLLTVIDDLAAEGAPGVLVCACGFVADHLEVLYDLDIEAAPAGRARRAGLRPHAVRERRPSGARCPRRPRGRGGRLSAMASIVIVGGGITGLAAAHRIHSRGPAATSRSRCSRPSERLGGKIRTSPFAGLPAVDEGPDAFLARVPEAVDLARASWAAPTSCRRRAAGPTCGGTAACTPSPKGSSSACRPASGRWPDPACCRSVGGPGSALEPLGSRGATLTPTTSAP